MFYDYVSPGDSLYMSKPRGAMGVKSRRANYKKGSTWREGNSIDKRSSIGIGCLNINGWSKVKENDVLQAIESKQLDVFSLIETKKKPKSKRIEIEGFKVFEVRRKGDNLDGGSSKEGGGLACMVKTSAGVTFSQHQPLIKDPQLNYVSSERLWVKYTSPHGKTALCTVYMGFQAQDNRHLKWNEGIYQVLTDEIRDLRGQGYRVILVGDYNAWIGNVAEQGGIPGNNARVTPNGMLFLEFLSNNNLSNVNAATRVINGVDKRICDGLWTRHASDYASSSILDYVVVSKEHIWSALEMEVDQNGAHGGGSDHNMLFSRWSDKFISIPKVQPIRKPGWDREGADWDKFRRVIQEETDKHNLETKSIDSLSEALTRILTKGLTIAAGKKSSAPPKQKLFPRHIVCLMKERKALEKIFKTEKSRFAGASNNPLATNSLIVAKDNLDAKTEELNIAKSRFERQNRRPLLNLAKSKSRKNRKKFWDFVNRKTKRTTGVPPLQDKTSGILIHDNQDIANMARDYLKDIFSGSDDPISSPPNMDATVGDFYGQGDDDFDGEQGGVGAALPHGALGAEYVPASNTAATVGDFYVLEDGGNNEDSSDGGAALPPSAPSEQSIPSPNMDATVGDFYTSNLPPATSRDHEYCLNANPRLPTSGSSGFADDDPSGFLAKDFSVEEVYSIVKSLGNGKASGHDELINEALKEAPTDFIKLLRILFNMVKNQGRAPRSWKRGRIVLIHKKGSESDINNYRPLTVLPCICGTYSKLINSRLTEVVERHGLLGEIQNGFRKDRSGLDSAFVLNTILWKSMAKKKKVNLAFLDLQKAYDSVSRETLWKKMAKFGFSTQFIKSIQCLYDGDFVTSDVNGITTSPVFLGRGLRQGCSLSPILFALYVSDMSRDLHDSKLGFTLHRVCISSLFFADDIVLIARDADGLRLLRDIVQRHCAELDMTLSVSKSKVMSTTQDLWELFVGDTVIGTLEKIIEFKYLGIKTQLNPRRSALAMMERAKSLANSYRKTCVSFDYDGPDSVDLSLCLWQNVAIPSILYGCEIVPFSSSAIKEIERHQSAVGKFSMGLPVSAPNISTTSILGVAPFKEMLYGAQLRYLARLLKQDDRRWSKDAFFDHFLGNWDSPYLRYMDEIRDEVNLPKWPTTSKEVEVALTHHFVEENNQEIERLCLPALRPLDKRERMEFANESRESQVFNTHTSTVLLHLIFT